MGWLRTRAEVTLTPTLPIDRPSPSRALSRESWQGLVLGFVTLVSLSGIQLYVQGLEEGLPGTFSGVFLSNLVASLPWLPLAFGIFALIARFPLDQRSNLAIHLVAAFAVPGLFLVWLAAFHSWITAAPQQLDGWLRYGYWLRRDLAEFSTVAVLVHILIVLSAQVTLRRRMRRESPPHQPQPVANQPVATVRQPEPLVIRSVGRTRRVDPRCVDWVAAEGSYARLHTGESSRLIRCSLADLAETLAPLGFRRIHRSTLVQLDRVVEVRPRSHGDADVVLRDGRALRVSRTYRSNLDL